MQTNRSNALDNTPQTPRHAIGQAEAFKSIKLISDCEIYTYICADWPELFPPDYF